MKCLVQPGDGIAPMVKAIEAARESIQIVIFRFDRREIERALEAAVARGVHVHALTAFTNKGGEKGLRALELRLLGAGVTVARTANDLVRYHGKFMVIDHRELHLMAFNFTWLDIERSRSFGVICRERKLVQEAVKLFEADVQRGPYSAANKAFVVSPVNARARLIEFIKGAKKELLIYDPEVSDPEILRLLEVRARAGVTIQIIGRVAKNGFDLAARKLHIRLHTRTIVRDGAQAFIGSQSLRTLELDSRREVGVIVRDPAIVSRIAKTFREDWNLKDQQEAKPVAPEAGDANEAAHAGKVARKVAKAVTDDMAPISEIVETTVRQMSGPGSTFKFNNSEVEATVKNAVADAVKDVVRGFMEDAVDQMEADAK